jgi:hypothetical protein
MKLNKYYTISIIILVLELAVAMWLGAGLAKDASVPIHWNYHNQIDGYTTKTVGIFGIWGFNVGLFLLLILSILSARFISLRKRKTINPSHY